MLPIYSQKAMKMKAENSTSEIVQSSFRDPCGFVFWSGGKLYRQVNKIYKDDYGHLMASGLYPKLVDSGHLIAHREAKLKPAVPEISHKIIQPDLLPFISYPYEWSFSQLKDAALFTLEIQLIALEFGMSLKDCSAYNVQFVDGRPIFIDTLSFEKYREGQPWVAYRQFCQHFLAPLALMSYCDVRLGHFFRNHIDGVPLDLASCLLPMKTRFVFSLLSHIHFHAKSQKHYADKPINSKARKVSRTSLLGIVDSLKGGITRLNWRLPATEWGEYYNDTNYSGAAFEHKKTLINEFLDKAKPGAVWDLGANTGVFSRVAGSRGIPTVAFDIDPVAIEKNYLQVKQKKESNILPLFLDLKNPSPGIGWQNQERMTIFERGPVDAVMALALIHHLAISNNLPLLRIAEFFSKVCRSLIIEFVPKQDSQVQRLLSSRPDIFPGYTKEGFEQAFSQYFKILRTADVRHTERTMYLMKLNAQ